MKQTILTAITRQPYARMLRKVRKEFCQGRTIRLTDTGRFAGGAPTNAFSERFVTYDRNGNILSLTRYGADTAVPEEALAYSYNGNMLADVSNSGSSGGEGTYAHDTNGNLTRDGLSGLDIRYDDLNLTSRISSGDTTLAEYGHLADGTVSYRSLIHLRDHLGSVRAVIDGDTGSVLEANDYYPFGKRIPLPVSGAVPVTGTLSVTVVRQAHQPVEVTESLETAESLEATVASTSSATATGSATAPNRWLFSGKESQSFLSASIPLLDFGARMYDPITARWTAQDPLAEKYYAVSPYAYCLGNPISHIDDDGQMPQVVAGAIIGAAVGGIMAAVEGKNWREIGGAAVGGAIEGALVSATGGMSLLGSKAAATVLSAGVASAVGSTANQLVGEGSVDAKQVVFDAGIGSTFGGFVKPTFNKVANNLGDRIATEAQQKYSSKAVRSSVETEVKKEMKMSGINLGGKSGSRMVKIEVEGRLASQRDFEFSIGNAIRDTKVGDVASDVAAHKVSLLIYNSSFASEIKHE